MKVLDTVIQSDIAKGSISLVKGNEITKGIAIVIKVGGASEGNIILNMEIETALKICSVMNGEDFKSLTPFGIDAISELANMIAGNATSALTDMGFNLTVSPPAVVMNNNGGICETEVFQVPLYTECGEITVNAALRTN
jgi:chemotaxis protein CheX